MEMDQTDRFPKRVPSGVPVYPLQSQREQYDRWFQGVAHGYDLGSRE